MWHDHKHLRWRLAWLLAAADVREVYNSCGVRAFRLVQSFPNCLSPRSVSNNPSPESARAECGFPPKKLGKFEIVPCRSDHGL